ncbi:IS5 family transposase [Pseudomonadota bacterium]
MPRRIHQLCAGLGRHLHLLPELPKRPDHRGRPWRDSREVLNGTLWILRTGAQWSEMPSRYPPYQTCHRRFQQWRESGVMDRLLEALARDLERRGKINLEECFIDGSFSPAKKGALEFGKTKRGKGSKNMAIADRTGLPVALCTGSASPHETKFVTELIDQCFTEDKHERLIGDKAYDSDPLDAACAAKGVTMISPHKTNRKKPKSQDGRALRRYNRRWKVERLFAWLQNYRRLVTRFEYHIENFLAFLKLAAFMILAKKYL